MTRLALALLLVPALALAEDPAPLRAGDPAPYAGILLDEPRLLHFLALDLRVKELEGEVGARDKALVTLEAQLAVEKQRQISETWWSRNKLWFGVALGVAASAAVVYAVK
jgi:hypothetical protein